MKRTTLGTRLADLIRLLGGLEELNKQLAAVLEAKIGVMARADVAGMAQCEDNERKLVEQLRDRDGIRRQLMDSIGVELGLGPRVGRTLNLTQLGQRVPESERPALSTAADALRRAVLQVRQVERVASSVSREVLDHLRWVFAAVKPRDEKPNVYSGDGVFIRSDAASMVELVG